MDERLQLVFRRSELDRRAERRRAPGPHAPRRQSLAAAFVEQRYSAKSESLADLFRLVLTPDGYKAMQTEQPFLWYFEMAPFMAVPMVALMRHHGYRWRQCTEMSAAMLIPPAGLIALVQVGVTAYLPWFSTRTLPESTHIAMLLSMLVLMLYRRAEYSDRRHHRSC